MLKHFDVEQGLVLLGGTSDIGLEILKKMKVAPGCPLYLFSRQTLVSLNLVWPHGEVFHIECDLESPESFRSALNRINSFPIFDVAIIAVGYLPNESNEYDLADVQKTLRINGESVILFLSVLTGKLSEFGGGKILLISSVAAIRPRIRNFTYGASKSMADFFAIGLSSKYKNQGVQIRVLRPGFVFTKMTKSFSPAPFAISVGHVAQIALKALRSNKTVAYAPSILKLVMNILRISPRKIFDML